VLLDAAMMNKPRHREQVVALPLLVGMAVTEGGGEEGLLTVTVMNQSTLDDII
jgi:hypothetical protein